MARAIHQTSQRLSRVFGNDAKRFYTMLLLSAFFHIVIHLQIRNLHVTARNFPLNHLKTDLNCTENRFFRKLPTFRSV